MKKALITIAAVCILLIAVFMVSVSAADTETGYLTFSSADQFTLKTKNTAKNWDGKLEYSTDASAWTEWNGSEISSSSDGKLYLRGTGNTYLTSGRNNLDARFVLTGTRISCSGNIMTMLDYQTVLLGNEPVMADYAFYYLFYSCKTLISAPELPAEELKPDCYAYMFYMCTDLETAPTELPATTLAFGCYANMFSECDSLRAAPKLPATTLAENCYKGMFQSCHNLQTAPKLPATVLAERCYDEMFEGCVSLQAAPKLSATTLADYCYKDMFMNCTALTAAPALPATTLANNCYYSMFYGCSNLEAAPELPATVLAYACYERMFWNCKALTYAPELPATDLNHACYKDMFRNCTSLKYIPSINVSEIGDQSCYGMFYGCTGLKLSETQTEQYFMPFSITDATSGGNNWNKDMFTGTGGTFTGNPELNTVYYVMGCEHGLTDDKCLTCGVIKISELTFPDERFREQYVKTFDTNGDGYFVKHELDAVKEIKIQDANITSVVGIEYFGELTRFTCKGGLSSRGKLTAVDVSKNTKLTYLSCENNKIEQLDISGCTLLITLICDTNYLTSLDLSAQTELTGLYCTSNKLEALDLGNNSKLIYIRCSGNALKALDVSNMPDLETLYCDNNDITELDISQNKKITHLQIHAIKASSIDFTNNTALQQLTVGGSITSIDLSQNTELYSFSCIESELTELAFSNNLKLMWLNIYNNSKLTKLDITKNSEVTLLYCYNNRLTSLDLSANTKLSSATLNPQKTIDVYLDSTTLDLSEYIADTSSILSVTGGAYANGKVEVTADGTVVCSIDTKNSAYPLEVTFNVHVHDFGSTDVCACGWVKRSKVVFPDSNFRFLIGDFDTNKDGYFSKEELDAVTKIELINRGITSLVGIEYFENLEYLDISYPASNRGKITTLDLSGNPKLTYLDCSYQSIEQLNISNCPLLTKIYCRGNKLTSLDLSAQTELLLLNCSSNQIEVLDVSNNIKLQDLLCYDNALSALDVSKNEMLKQLTADGNKFNSLDVTNNKVLELLYVGGPLTSLDLSQNIKLTDVHLEDVLFTEIDLSSNASLTKLILINTRITYLDLSANPKMTVIKANNNCLTSLDLSNNKNLGTLELANNYLTSLDLSANTKLDFVTLNPQNTIDVTLDSPMLDLSKYVDTSSILSVTGGAYANGKVEVTADGTVVCSIDTKNSAYPLEVTFNVTSHVHDFGSTDVCSCGWVKISSVTFPDAAFRDIISVSYDTDSDGYLSSDELAITNISVSHNTYNNPTAPVTTDLTGIELFTELKMLTLSNTALSSIDFTQNTKLEKVTINLNSVELNDLKLTGLVNLNYLAVTSSKLTALDVSSCVNLETLYCQYNKLQELDVSGNANLKKLEFRYNPITRIDLSGNTALTNVNDSQTSGQIGSGGYCERAVTSGIGAALDLSKYGDISKMSNVTSTKGTYNATTGIFTPSEDGTITVTYNYATGFGDYAMPVRVTFEYLAELPVTADYFPDDTLRSYVSEFDKDGNGKLSPSEIADSKSIYGTKDNNLSFVWETISSLEGLEYLTNLVEIKGFKINITEVDFSMLPKFSSLDFSYGQIERLILAGCSDVGVIYLSSNMLSYIDLTGCTKLRSLDIRNNKFTSLDLTGLSNIGSFKTSGNGVTISVCGRTVDMNQFGDITRMVNIAGATMDANGIATLLPGSYTITYDYDTNHSSPDVSKYLPVTITVNKSAHTDADSDKYCDICGDIADASGAKHYGSSVTLGGAIGLNFYMELSADTAANADAYMLFTFPNGATSQMTVAEATTRVIGAKTYYIFTCKLNAKQMADVITAKMVVGAVSGPEITYSVTTYANNIITANTESAEVISVIKAMLNYGAAAQENFGYNTDNLANAILSEDDKAIASIDGIDFSAYTKAYGDNLEGLTYKGTSLLLDSNVAIKHYFILAENASISDYEFTVDNKILTPVYDSEADEYYVIISDVPAIKLNLMYTLTVSKNGTSATQSISYGAFSYINNIASQSEGVQKVVKAMYWYNIEITEYINSLSK